MWAKATDISDHYRQHWQGTGFKAQLVAPSREAAVHYKEALDEIGHVSSEIIMSNPKTWEGHEEPGSDSNSVLNQFWKKMMLKYKTEDEYNRQIVANFHSADDPEILIVISKLLTGFDAPRNTILYVCKNLTDLNLLQAIARVNRLFEEDKEFGF